MSNIIFSAFSDEYADSFKEQLVAMNGFGIDFIEVRHVDGKNVSKLSREEIKKAQSELCAYNIKVSAIGSPLGKIRLNGDMAAHFEDAKRVYDAANELGAKYVRMFSFYAPRGENIIGMKDAAVNAVGELLDLSKQFGVTLCHENEANIYGDTPARCAELLEIFGGELKCVFDMGNFVLEGVDPYPEAYMLLRDQIAYFHIKDAFGVGAIVPPGCGEAKIAQILSEHKNYAGEDFFASLEPHLQTFSGLNALVGRSFDNPYKYEDQKSAFSDAVAKFKSLDLL